MISRKPYFRRKLYSLYDCPQHCILVITRYKTLILTVDNGVEESTDKDVRDAIEAMEGEQ